MHGTRTRTPYRVRVRCHIGPGASWFVPSKLSGTRQVFAVAFGTFSRPTPSPVRNLRPARDTCEQCHWPEKFHGDKVNVRREYASDEANTETVTTIRVHVGGGSEKLGIATGIHWHMNVAPPDELATRHVRAWLFLVAALALHVADEVLTGFLDFYNPLVLSIRSRAPWFPMPTFTFDVWLVGLIALVLFLALLAPVIRRGEIGGQIVSWVLIGIVLLNGLGHLTGSLYFGRWLPGTTSAPILLIASVLLARRTSERSDRRKVATVIR